LRQVDGLNQDRMEALVAGRPYRVIEDLQTRAGLTVSEIEKLAAADAFRSIGLDRRQALWEARALSRAKPLPLFAATEISEKGDEPETSLPAMPLAEHVIADYRTIRMSLKAHPMTSS
jgi:error-prone DNA polymerase